MVPNMEGHKKSQYAIVSQRADSKMSHKNKGFELPENEVNRLRWEQSTERKQGSLRPVWMERAPH